MVPVLLFQNDFHFYLVSNFRLISYTQVIILTVLIIHVPTNLAAKTVFSDKKP